MSRTWVRAGCFAALLAAAARPAFAQPLAPAPFARGEVTFLIHSSFVGRIEGRAPIARAEFSGEALGAVHGFAEVAVAKITTANGSRDAHLRETLDADSYPTVRFDLVGVQAGPAASDSTAVTLEGRLTLHGVTRPVTAQGHVVLRGAGADVVASFPLDMRDFGITPPVRALILRVAPDVVVTAHLSFAPAPP